MLSLVIIIMGVTDAAKPWCANFAVMMAVNTVGSIASGGLDVGKHTVKLIKYTVKIDLNTTNMTKVETLKNYFVPSANKKLDICSII